MNLQTALKGLFGFLFGNDFVAKPYDKNTDGSYNENSYTDFSGAISNLGAKLTGSRLTSAEREANAFTAAREDLAWERQMEASNTAYQRQVADMKAAGLNPMLALGAGGASSPSASSSGSVSPTGGSLNLGSIISALVGIKQANAEVKLKDAQTENVVADTAKKEAETASTKQQYNYFARVEGLRAEGEKLANDVSFKQAKLIEQNIAESKTRVKKDIAETQESEKRALLLIEQAIQAKAEVENMKYLQPFIAGELSARTASERNQAKVAAVDAAYRQGLIDNGAIEAAIRRDNASASDLEITAKTKEFVQSINDGSLQKAADALGDWRTGLVAGLYTALNGAVKSALGKW